MIPSSMIQFLNGYILEDSLRRWFLPSRIHFLDNSFPLWLQITTVHFLDGFVDGIFYQRDQSYKLKKRLPKIFFRPKFQTPLVTITNHDNFFPRRLETSTTFLTRFLICSFEVLSSFRSCSAVFSAASFSDSSVTIRPWRKGTHSFLCFSVSLTLCWAPQRSHSRTFSGFSGHSALWPISCSYFTSFKQKEQRTRTFANWFLKRLPICIFYVFYNS